jgi:hypothetical protein
VGAALAVAVGFTAISLFGGYLRDMETLRLIPMACTDPTRSEAQ